MRYGSVCSGIEAATVAWHAIGWMPAWLAEIEAFPSAVLAHHYPDVPNLGDMTALPERIRSGDIHAPDVFVGGTPCQAFSVAGLRQSLADARGNLSLTYCEIANAIDDVRRARSEPAAVIAWENVPGCLSTSDNAFGHLLAGLAGEGQPLIPEPCPAAGKSSRYWKWKKKTGQHSLSWSVSGCVIGPRRTVAWRVLDAQFFGLAQRRRRVFVVASARSGFDPAAVLFEFDGVRRDTAPSREAREGTAAGTLRSTDGGSDVDHGRAGHLITMAHGQGGAEIAEDRAPTLTCNHEAPIAFLPETAHTLRAEGFDASEGGTGRGTPLVPVAFQGRGSNIDLGQDVTGTLGTNADRASGGAPCVAFDSRQDPVSSPHISGALGSSSPQAQAVASAMQVRRLTPRECERLQGFPDDYTMIPWRTWQEAQRKGVSYETLLRTRGMTLRGPSVEECPDGPRYKALGNSMAVPVMRWIGRRISDAITSSDGEA